MPNPFNDPAAERSNKRVLDTARRQSAARPPAPPRPYWTCVDVGPPYRIRVVLAADAFAARDVLCPMAVVAPCALVSPGLLEQVADLQPDETREFEVPALPSWRDVHGDRLSSASYCEDIGYDPT